MALLITARRLARFLKREKPDLVVTKGLFAHFYGGLAARRLRIPCIWHAQDFISERLFGVYRRGFGLVARWLPGYVIVDGAAIADQLPHSMQNRTSVIHNGVDSNVFRPGLSGAAVREEFGLPTDAIVIGHIARMTPWKGQHYLLEAFARIAQEAPNAYLLFVGDPVFDTDAYQCELLDLTAKLGLQNRVKFAGYRHDIPEVLAAMDIFAFTSVEKDTSPLALLSAMSSGLPIVAFDIEGVRELIDGDGQLMTVPVAQADALASVLLKLVFNQQLRWQLGQSVRELAVRRFSLERHVVCIEEVLMKVYQQRRLALTDQVSSLTPQPLPNVHDCG
jgi:glycosyltransferase involved in cell wall biosynthesis